MAERSLDALTSPFYLLACEWIARVTARGVAVMIVQTRRTMVEHQANLAAGTSGTSLSLHLPRSLRPATVVGVQTLTVDFGKADAMDLAPYDQYNLHGPDKLKWDSKDPAWGVIGEEAEKLGLRWGGRWKSPFDPGHAELALPSKHQLLVAERARPWPTFRIA